MKEIFEHIENNINETINNLFRMVSQPSVSAQSNGFDRAPDLMCKIAEEYGLKTTILRPDNNGFPSIFAEKKSKNSDKTLLFYTHYDVQPPDPLELWESDPFKPEKIGDRLYGRGMSDDKGNIAARLAAIKAFLDIEKDLPVNIKLFMEGEEEIGSRNLLSIIDKNKNLLSADACIWEGGGRNMSNNPFIYLGLKGVLSINMKVKKLNVDAHSSYAPILPSAIERLTLAINSFKNEFGHIIIKDFHSDILPLSDEERNAILSLPNDSKEWEDTFGIDFSEYNNESIDDMKIKLYAEPTANVAGFNSGYNGPGMKTVLPSVAECKMDFRLVPDQNPNKIFKNIKDHLIQNGFSDIDIEPFGKVFPYRTNISSPLVNLVKETAFQVYKKEPVVSPNNPGSGPMYEFGGMLGLPVVSAGIDHPTHKIHAPNENITVEDLILGSKHIALIMKKLVTNE
ncbi:MAG: peptidase M20 [Chloroflexi bacterium]|nr:peptidase M20 [Chloroflexota bacterium]|tara:strand:+ start:7835 stop:9196 length:1362 start_codon:yes stop_codon:yes gene_type:complete